MHLTILWQATNWSSASQFRSMADLRTVPHFILLASGLHLEQRSSSRFGYLTELQSFY